MGTSIGSTIIDEPWLCITTHIASTVICLASIVYLLVLNREESNE